MGIQARSMEVFARLGISNAVAAEALPLEGQAFHLSRGSVTSRFTGVHSTYPAMAILPQSRTEQLLETCVPKIEWGRRFFAMAGENAALVSRADGSIETITARWIVGCDGAHSAVREAVGLAFDGKDFDAQLVLADCRLEGLTAELFHVFLERPMIAFAAPSGLWRVVAVVPRGEVLEEGDLASFARDGVTLSDPQWWSRFTISQRSVPRLQAGRILLAGDAAHVHSPAGGQGMNVGVQDAWWLSGAIVEGEDAVAAWALERKAVADRLLRATERTTRAMLSAPEWLSPVRDLGVGLMARNAGMRRRLEGEVAGLQYREVA